MGGARREHARLFVIEARKAGARPVLLMAWAYERLGWITMDEIARAHRAAAAELNVDVAPDREHPSIHG